MARGRKPKQMIDGVSEEVENGEEESVEETEEQEEVGQSNCYTTDGKPLNLQDSIMTDSVVPTKTLNVTNIAEAKKKINDIKVTGDGDMFKLLCKASSESEGWMKSTKACEIQGAGCLVQVTTQQGDNVAEALTFVPRVKIVNDVNGGYKLISY